MRINTPVVPYEMCRLVKQKHKSSKACKLVISASFARSCTGSRLPFTLCPNKDVTFTGEGAERHATIATAQCLIRPEHLGKGLITIPRTT
eukprot:1103576-Amphidinium_carterae.1